MVENICIINYTCFNVANNRVPTSFMRYLILSKREMFNIRNKIKVYRLITFLMGISTICFGIILVVKSNFGVSVISSVPYVYSLKFQNITFGIWSYIVQIIPFLILVLSLKKLKIKYLLSFLMAYLFGKTLDMFNLILPAFDSNNFMFRLSIYTFGIVSIAFGISLWIKSQYLMQPCDIFIKEFSEVKNISVGKVKTYFDISCLSLSVVSSLLFLGEVKGIYLGTLISAFTTGVMVKFFLDIQNRYIEDIDVLNNKKIDYIVEYDFLKGKSPLKEVLSS